MPKISRRHSNRMGRNTNRSKLNLIGKRKKKGKRKNYQNTKSTEVTGKAIGLNMTAEESRHMVMSYLLTYFPWSRAPLEKLTGSAASQEIPRIFGTRRFLTVPTIARHLGGSLSPRHGASSGCGWRNGLRYGR